MSYRATLRLTETGELPARRIQPVPRHTLDRDQTAEIYDLNKERILRRPDLVLGATLEAHQPALNPAKSETKNNNDQA